MAATSNNRQGEATRQRLVKAAERLFAAHGVDAVSVRAINAAAGQGPASVHYHFGSKENLLAAVLLGVGADVRDRIAGNVAALAARPTAPTAAEVVHALTDPYLALLLKHRVRGMRWVQIVVQVSRGGRPAVEATGQDAVAASLREQVRRAFPDCDGERLELRWPIVVMGYLQTLSHAEDLATRGGRVDREQLVAFHEDLVAFTIGGAERMLGPKG
ncbi:TetR/AcrR family transcriptional regulator [Streptomyces cavernicola]|uniref:TetR/AcrR family transcriptional regulator n=1 Tax=Streptomyces cavernicola TaxID=3043613 RepID=A0ABT6SC11_9ACTN|nr:TetR/AcrR family transcriptional regulator [Streptomyces sp. B-S-A6]MDI3405733.1 TetR/AcrR family transcriptional regulator [Streptomyces sp. B-S-A6]